MSRLVVISMLVALSACGSGQHDSAKLQDAKYRAVLEGRGIGRFQITPAAQDYPPFVLDTVTGCVVSLTKDGVISKRPVFEGGSSDHACLGDMPRDQERETMETLKK